MNDSSDHTPDPADALEARLRALGDTPTPPADRVFVQRLGADLRRSHSSEHRGVGRVLLPTLAAAAILAVVALWGGQTRVPDAGNGVAGIPFQPSPATTPADGRPQQAERPDPSPESEDRGTPAPATSDAAPDDVDGPSDSNAPSHEPEITDEPGTTRPDPVVEDPPPSTPTTAVPDRTTTTTVDDRADGLRVSAVRRDDGSVIVEWARRPSDDVAGWRIRRIARVGDRQDETTILVSRRPELRRHLDEPPGPASRLVYVVAALDQNGRVIAETRAAVD